MTGVVQILLATFGIATVCLFPLALAYLFVLFRMFRILDRNHSEAYRDLGSPTLFLNNTIGNSFRFQRFLLAKGYKDLNDPPLTRLGNIAHAMLVFGIVVLIGLVVSYIAYGVIVRPH